MVKILKTILISAVILCMSSMAYAQQEENKSKLGPRKQLATIIFAGLGGAVLGLSTLSFYGRPQDRLANIAVGFAVGIIVGTVYVTYGAATKPKEFYGYQDRFESITNREFMMSQMSERRAPQTLNFSIQF